jgi:hypothetical protein
MALDRKYGQVSVPGIPEDEPIFILRGQDSIAYAAIMQYAALCESAGTAPEHVEHARKSADVLSYWPVKKLPDTKRAG